MLDGLPRRFKFKRIDDEDESEDEEATENETEVDTEDETEDETEDDAGDEDKFVGVYEFYKFGTYDGRYLKFGSMEDGMRLFTPIWIRTDSKNDKNFYFFFNQKLKQWQIHEEEGQALTEDHLCCETGSFNHTSVSVITKSLS